MADEQRIIERIAFIASASPAAEEAQRELVSRYGDSAPETADVVVALGGDGLMLQALHRFMNTGIPIYGMNRGSVGFLMNEYSPDGLRERLSEAKPTTIHPLSMRAVDLHGNIHVARAINEVSLLRQTHQAAKLAISVDGRVRLAELICDGALVATPAGSTAYNLSAQGPILPIRAPLLALTPISPFRPRRWRGALLPASADIVIEVLEAEGRPVSATADNVEFRFVTKVEIRQDSKAACLMLFDPGHSLEERILREQFGY